MAKLAQSYINEFPDWIPVEETAIIFTVDIDDCIYQAMLIKKDILNNSFSNNIPGEEYSFEKNVMFNLKYSNLQKKFIKQGYATFKIKNIQNLSYIKKEVRKI